MPTPSRYWPSLGGLRCEAGKRFGRSPYSTHKSAGPPTPRPPRSPAGKRNLRAPGRCVSPGAFSLSTASDQNVLEGKSREFLRPVSQVTQSRRKRHEKSQALCVGSFWGGSSVSRRFRQQAENFLRLAKETDSPRLRWVLVEMAQICYRLSERAQPSRNFPEEDRRVDDKSSPRTMTPGHGSFNCCRFQAGSLALLTLARSTHS
jgi:hypothetical protein